MLAIAANALYTSLRRRGTTRQLAGAILTCVISALLLLPAIIWYNLRFEPEQGTLSMAEVEVGLVYVALWGWLLPLSVTTSYCLFTLPRTSTSSALIEVPSQGKRTTRGNARSAGIVLPNRQPGMPAPFVYAEDIPWGWLEHRAGRFQGQRLALNRQVMSIGREEDNDIWLDDDTASRYHAELTWDAGQAYITDCDSMNGVLLNGRRIRGTLIISPGDLFEIGSHRFLFEKAEPTSIPNELSDPLLNHMRLPSNALDDVRQTLTNDIVRSAQMPMSTTSPNLVHDPLRKTTPLEQKSFQHSVGFDFDALSQQFLPPTSGEKNMSDGFDPGNPALDSDEEWQDTIELDSVPSPHPHLTASSSAFIICNGEMAGRSFLLYRPVLTIGRGSESDVVIRDASISRRHAQVLRQVNGDYVQDLASRNGTKVNNEQLHAPYLLQEGDVVWLGNICLKYTSIQEAQATPLLPLTVPPLASPLSNRLPLRLPSKFKIEVDPPKRG